MAFRGRKPSATALKLVKGNPGKRRLPTAEPLPCSPIERPSEILGKPAALWDRFIARAYWLSWAAGPKALMWCYLQAEFEHAPKQMVASGIAQLRALGSELGFDPSSRSRLDARPLQTEHSVLDWTTLYASGARGYSDYPALQPARS
jgi:hypothetical protein